MVPFLKGTAVYVVSIEGVTPYVFEHASEAAAYLSELSDYELEIVSASRVVIV